MQLVPPRQQDTDNGFSWVIQNVYKVRNIVPQAMPKPVSIDQGLQLLRDFGIGDNSAEQVPHPSKWTDSPTFDPLSFLDSVSYFKTPAILKPIVRSSPAKATSPKITAGWATGSTNMTTKVHDIGATSHGALASLASSVISTPPSRTESSGPGRNGLNDLIANLQNRESRKRDQAQALFPNWERLKAENPQFRLLKDILYEPLEDDDQSETESLPRLQNFRTTSYDDSDVDVIMSPNSSSQNSPPVASASGSLKKRNRVAVKAPKSATVAATTRTGKRARANVDDTVTQTAPIKRLRTQAGRSKLEGAFVADDDVVEID